MISLKKNRIRIFDTTLRDGEQAGHQTPPKDKLAIAHRLADIGVDVIEAGFPCSSGTDFDSVASIAKEVEDPVIAALSRMLPQDIESAVRALEGARRPRIHTFASTSPVHMKKKLRMSEGEVFDRATAAVRQAKSYYPDVEFSPEDATRTDLEFLARICRGAIEAGATTINITDTVGIIVPHEFSRMLNNLIARVPELDPYNPESKVTLSVHCHNDLGNALQNTLVGIMYGARQVEGCFIGIGERAGNVSLEQVVTNLWFHGHDKGYFRAFDTGIDISQLVPTCQFISGAMGYPIPAHQPIIGSSVFEHSSGIHADGVRKDEETYEIMRPELVGHTKGKPRLVTHLGHGGIAGYLEGLGYEDSDLLAEQIHDHFKMLAGLKGELSVDDMHMLVQEVRIRNEAVRDRRFYFPDEFSIDFGPRHAAVNIQRNGDEQTGSSDKGDGVFDCVIRAIHEALCLHGIDFIHQVHLDDYRVEKGSGDGEANAWVVCKVRFGNRVGYARSADTDIVVASAKAYLEAVNNLIAHPLVLSS